MEEVICFLIKKEYITFMIKSPKIIITLMLVLILAVFALFMKKDSSAPNKQVSDNKQITSKIKPIVKPAPNLIEDEPSIKTMKINESGSLKFNNIKESKTEKTTKILPTINSVMDNVIIEKRNGFFAINNTPKETLAYKLCLYEQHISWKPKWHFSGVGKILIRDVVLSSDESLLAFIETTGDTAGPYGSQIILVNTYNWEVLQIIKISRLISKCCFIAETMKLALLCEPQKLLEHKGEVIIYDLETKLNKNLNIATEISDIVINNIGTKLFIKPKLQKNIKVIDLVDYSINIIESNNNMGVFDIDDSSNILLCGGDNFIEKYSLLGYNLMRKIELPKDTNVVSIKLINQKDFVFIDNNANISFYKDNVFLKKIDEEVSALMSFDNDAQILIVESKINKTFKLFSYPEMQLITSVAPARVRPKMRHSSAMFIRKISRLNKYLVFDKFGNLYSIYKPKKKWKKDFISAIFNVK